MRDHFPPLSLPCGRPLSSGGSSPLPQRRRVMFADEAPIHGSTKLLNVCLFDKEEEPIECNPNKDEVARVRGLFSHSDSDGLNFDFTKLCSCRTVPATPSTASAHGETTCASDSSSSITCVTTSPMPQDQAPGTVLRTDPYIAPVIREFPVPIPDVTSQSGATSSSKRSAGRKVRSLWLTFTLKAEAETEDWGMVGLATAQFNDRASVLMGKVRVQNIDFHKEVFVRCTVDNWKSHRDVQATYESSSEAMDYDIFSFAIPVPINIAHGRKVAFAIGYRANGKEFWDNNDGANYEGRVVFGITSPTMEQRRSRVGMRSLEEALEKVSHASGKVEQVERPVEPVPKLTLKWLRSLEKRHLLPLAPTHERNHHPSTRHLLCMLNCTAIGGRGWATFRACFNLKRRCARQSNGNENIVSVVL